MCGIVGYVGKREAIPVLLKGLKRLEYRGYDSAGVAFFQGNELILKKSEGKLENVQSHLTPFLSEKQGKSEAKITCGIGHTRWATHGKPTTQNAHPHQTGHVVLVHNGIIENYQEIKADLIARGHKPKSETDSELFGFLVFEEMERGSKLAEAVRLAFRHLQGSCSVVVMSKKEPGVIIGVRNGSPLVIATDPEGGAIIASDAQPILEYTRNVVFMENGDMAIANAEGFEIKTLETGQKVERSTTLLNWSADQMDKEGYAHYMLKEIHEQPTALIDTLNGILDRATGEPFVLAEQPGVKVLKHAKGLILVACGTSSYAAMVGKYWIEKLAKIPVQVELASEFRYRDPVIPEGTVVAGISQSGETADTLAVIRDLKVRNIPTLAITNVRGSTLSREADATFFTSAGPEIGVAATKTFSSQLMALLLWAGALAAHRKTKTSEELEDFFQDLVKLPHLLKEELDSNTEFALSIQRAAKNFQNSKGFFFIGRGYSFPLALEGALKLKEIAYVNAEGYAAGELKHGPIAMIDEGMCVVVLAPQDTWRDKTVSNLEEVKARGAKILGVGTDGDQRLHSLCDEWIALPSRFHGELRASLLPFVLAPVVQLLSYELALLKGTDVDQPRNLAKSVTVE